MRPWIQLERTLCVSSLSLEVKSCGNDVSEQHLISSLSVATLALRHFIFTCHWNVMYCTSNRKVSANAQQYFKMFDIINRFPSSIKYYCRSLCRRCLNETPPSLYEVSSTAHFILHSYLYLCWICWLNMFGGAVLCDPVAVWERRLKVLAWEVKDNFISGQRGFISTVPLSRANVHVSPSKGNGSREKAQENETWTYQLENQSLSKNISCSHFAVKPENFEEAWIPTYERPIKNT